MEWWQICLITLTKGISWSLPILAFIFGLIVFINNVTKEVVDKAKKKYTNESSS